MKIKFIKTPFLFLLVGVLSAILTGVFYFFLTISDLPPVAQLKIYHPPLISYVLDKQNEIVGEFFKERRILSPYKEFPEVLVQAFVSAEDGSFFKHKGLNLKAIFRAFLYCSSASRFCLFFLYT